jgi:hypothetical protein
MTGDPRANLLGNEGYVYDDRLDVWINSIAGRALSGAIVRTSTEAWLARWILLGAKARLRRPCRIPPGH